MTDAMCSILTSSSTCSDAVGGTLVTSNTGEFRRVPGLVIESWRSLP